jgi:hypothetical protein
MKKILTVALLVLVCACCLTSCAQIEQEIGKAVSVKAVEAVAAELDEQGVTYEFADEQVLADLTAELKDEYDVELQGELTAFLRGEYTNPQTDEWVEYLVIGFSATADADAVEKALLEELKVDIEEGTAIVVNGGYIVNVTVSSVVIEQE